MLLLLLAPAIFACGNMEQETRSTPNIVLVVADDHGVYDVGAYGNNVVRTPNLDRLAAEGLRFTQAFAVTAMCTPSRSSIYTGLYPHRHGAHMNHGSIRPGIRTLPEYLKPLGYRVGLAGKKHIRPEEQFEFEYMELEPESVKNFMTPKGRQPFALIVAPNEPHSVNRTFPESDRFAPSDVLIPPYLVDTLETRRQRAGYYELIARLDEKVGVLIQAIEDQDILDETVFVFTSDHGAGFPFEKWTCYEAGLRVPLIVRWSDRVAPGSETSAMVSLVDLLPTFIEIGGGIPPETIDGRSFLTVLEGKTREHRAYVHGAHTTRGIFYGSVYPVRSVRSQTHKYIRNLNSEGVFTNVITEESGQGGWFSWLELAAAEPETARRVELYQRRPVEELYNLVTDPYELDNVAQDIAYQEILNELRAELDNWMAEQADRGLEAERELEAR